MRTIIFTLFILATNSHCIYAQSLDSFRLRDFKLPQLFYHALDVDFFSKGQNFNQPPEGKTNNFAANGNLNYYQFRNTPRLQAVLSAHVDLNFEKTNQSSVGGIYSRSQVEKRYYHEDQKKFHGYFLELNTNNTLQNIKQQSDQDFYSGDFRAAYLFGWGRVEEVTAGWRAWYMLKSMEELSAQPGKFSSEQVHGLAHLLADIARTRFYDFRLKMLEDFDRIDQYLTAQILYPLRDIRYFTRLQDMYWNSTQENRFSGQRFHFMPQINLHKETGYYTYGLGLHAGYEKFLPINMQWQINYHIQGGYNYQLFQDTDGYNRHVWQGLGSFSLAYYPDTRNIFTLKAAINGSNSMDKKIFGGTAGLSYYRYFSPQLRFSVDMSYAHSAVTTQRAVNSFNYGLGLNYAIF